MRSHQRVFLQHFKLSFCCFLASTLSDKKPAVILIIVFLCVIYLFLWLLLRFCLSLFISSYTMFPGVIFFVFMMLGVHLFPWICRLLAVVSFYPIWKTFGQYFFKSFFMPHSLSSSVTTLILDFLLLNTGHSRLCSFFFSNLFVSVL